MAAYHFYFPGFLGTCQACQKQTYLKKSHSQLHPVQVPDQSLSKYGMDLLGPLKESDKGNIYIMVLTDYLTKWPEAVALPDKSAKTVCEALVEIFCRLGIPTTVITDQGREFCNKVNDSMCRLLGITHKVTSPYHPQGNGLTERFNKTLTNCLIKYVNSKQTDWDIFLPTILFANRTSKNRATNATPYELVYGKEAKLPCDDFVDGDDSHALEDRLKRLEKIAQLHLTAKDQIKEEQAKQKVYYDKRHKQPMFREGDKVLVKNSQKISRKGGKLEDRFFGPYTVEAVTTSGSVRIKDRKQLVAPQRLKPYRSR